MAIDEAKHATLCCSQEKAMRFTQILRDRTLRIRPSRKSHAILRKRRVYKETGHEIAAEFGNEIEHFR